MRNSFSSSQEKKWYVIDNHLIYNAIIYFVFLIESSWILLSMIGLCKYLVHNTHSLIKYDWSYMILEVDINDNKIESLVDYGTILVMWLTSDLLLSHFCCSYQKESNQSMKVDKIDDKWWLPRTNVIWDQANIF